MASIWTKEYKKEYMSLWRKNNQKRLTEYENLRWKKIKELRGPISPKSITGLYRKDPNYLHAIKLKKNYDLTIEQYNELFNKQEGKCAICKRHQKQFKVRLSVDHNHVNGKIRGLLCINCNSYLLPTLENYSYVIDNAKNYLKEHNNG